MQFRSLDWEDPLEKEMATHTSILAWEIQWTEESGGLHIHAVKRVRHDLATKQRQQQLQEKRSTQDLMKAWRRRGGYMRRRCQEMLSREGDAWIDSYILIMRNKVVREKAIELNYGESPETTGTKLFEDRISALGWWKREMLYFSLFSFNLYLFGLSSLSLDYIYQDFILYQVDYFTHFPSELYCINIISLVYAHAEYYSYFQDHHLVLCKLNEHTFHSYPSH